MEGLKRLIDHAPLFPPASLGMGAAVAEDARARASEHSWMLARFVCPASRLTELEGALEPEGAPALSVVLDGGDWRDTPFRVEAVEMVGVSRRGPRRRRDVLRGPARRGLAGHARRGGGHRREGEDALRRGAGAERGAGRGVRRGGARRRAWPGRRRRGCTIRCAGEREHGFLNLLEAVGLAEEGADEAAVRAVLAERDPAALLGAAERPRGALFVSIGSCSFAEPVEDLQGLGLL